jgi:histone RNA hairpin-binding protein
LRKKRFRSERSSESSSTSGSVQQREFETDKATLDRRQKQIDFGKNTIGYDKYISEVPKHKRTREHPKTPPRNLKYSRRAWEGLIKSWRKKLHAYDPDNQTEDAEDDL